MSRSEATKRRKVWVTFDECEPGDDPVVHFGRFPGARPMVERLPGDVVLSREDAKWLLSKALVTDFESADDRARTLALLRGRR